MKNLSVRLACTLLSVLTILVLALLPWTRDLVRRDFWIFSGTYASKVGMDPGEYVLNNSPDDDHRILVLLNGLGKIPLESRTIELATIASKHKSPAIWAHVLRQTSMIPVQRGPLSKVQQMDQFRRKTMANLQLESARAGRALDPKNLFFGFQEAVGLANLGRWDEMGSVMSKLGASKSYDDYLVDELERRISGAQAKMGTLLPTEVGSIWSGMLFPHLANFKSLVFTLEQIQDPKERMAARLGLAEAGLTMEQNEDVYLNELVGRAIFVNTIREAKGVKTAMGQVTKAEVDRHLARLAAEARILGMPDAVKSWESKRHWEPRKERQLPFVDLNMDAAPFLPGVRALLAMTLLGVLATAFWLAQHLEPNSRSIATIGAILFGASAFPALSSVDIGGLLIAVEISSTGLFCSFLLLRLPGKERLGYQCAIASLVILAVPTILMNRGELLCVVTALWLIPYALTRWNSRSAPAWVGTTITTMFLTSAIWFVSKDFGRNPFATSSGLGDWILAAIAISAFYVPPVIALIMALTRRNLQDALSLSLAPFPFLALFAAIGFLWSVRTNLTTEELWRETSKKELSARYRQVIEGASNLR